MRDIIEFPSAGKYLFALSGGSDSVALMDLLYQQAKGRGLELEVAHFNHGYPGNDRYEATVRELMQRYDLPLHVGQSNGIDRSEAAAREARYDYLRTLMTQLSADAIITAHHRDDYEETVILNLLRGTGRRGLTPFETVKDVVRPALKVRKADLARYVQDHELTWCHDNSNDDLQFRRNQVRHQLLPRLRRDPSFDEKFESLIQRALELNRRIDSELCEFLDKSCKKTAFCISAPIDPLRRRSLGFVQELLVAIARELQPAAELDNRTVECLAVDLETGRMGRPRQLTKQLSANLTHGRLKVVFTP